jgi:hypothetical protein
MKEQQYQKKISDDLEKQGYFVINLIKTNRNGIPDLLALKKCNCDCEPIKFIECKTPKGKLSSIQEYMLTLLQNYSTSVSVSYGSIIKKWKNNSEKTTDLF